MFEIPVFLRDMLREQYGDLSQKIQSGYAVNRNTTFRVNTLKCDRSQIEEKLHVAGITFSNVPWYQDAFSTPRSEEEIQSLDFYDRGEVYLQSLSSMLPPLVLNVCAGESVLDMTAAPGGKTTQISALTQGKALITACEKDKIRFERLQYNVKKQGAPRVTLLCSDALKLDDFFRFDKILLDAPCSGSGTISLREKPVISEKLVLNCASLQRKLLLKAIKLLKRGGELVYSTCSVLRQENDDVVKSALSDGEVELLPLKNFMNAELLPSLSGTLCVLPDESFEGFYIAKFRKL